MISDYSSVSAQWQWLPGALAREWSAHHAGVALRAQMVALGKQFAAAHALPAVNELGELEQAVNRLWHEMHWGVASFKDNGQALRIVHTGAPIAQAFGIHTLAWSAGLLEGMYGTWLCLAGAPVELELRRVEPAGPIGVDAPLEFILAAPVPAQQFILQGTAP